MGQSENPVYIAMKRDTNEQNKQKQHKFNLFEISLSYNKFVILLQANAVRVIGPFVSSDILSFCTLFRCLRLDFIPDNIKINGFNSLS